MTLKAMGGRVAAINKPAFEETLRTTFNGRNYSQQIWGNTDDLAIKLKEVFKQAFIRGDGPQEMARAIRKEFNVARSRAETLVRTDGTAIMVRGTIKRYRDEGLKYYRVLVKLDERTTDICRGIAHENKLYLLDEAVAGVTAPPFHYNCRSTIMPDEGELNGEYKENPYSSTMSGALNSAAKEFDSMKTYTKDDDEAKRIYIQLAQRDALFEARKISDVIPEFTRNDGLMVYNHVFRERHELSEGYKLFAPDIDMAESFLRISNGQKLFPHDIIMLKHERHEAELMRQGLDYESAHAITQKLYNYQEASMAYRRRFK